MTKKEMQDKIFYLKMAIGYYEELVEHFCEIKQGMNKEKVEHALWVKKQAVGYKRKARGIE